MNSGGMKFSLPKGLVALSVLSCFAGVLCIGQLSADEDGQAVRFKLSDDGDSGKVIVVEKTPDSRDTKRGFENGLSFKRDEDGNIYRIGDFKEVAPAPIRKPANEVTQKPKQVPDVEEKEEPRGEENATQASLPELPSLDTLFPKLNWSGFEEAFGGIIPDTGSSTKRRTGTPGLKIKAAPQAPKTVTATPETQADLESQEHLAVAKSGAVIKVDPEPKAKTGTEAAEPVVVAPEAAKPEAAEPEAVAKAEVNVQEKAALVEEEKEVDSLTGLPLLADFELSDLGLPKLDLLDLNLFFGTSSEPLVNSKGEVPEEIVDQTTAEEPMGDATEDMPPAISPMETVVEENVESNEEVALKAKDEPVPASNTSLFELPSIDFGLGELLGITSPDEKKAVGSEPSAGSEVATEAVRNNSSMHRVPGRKSIGSNYHRSTKTNGTAGKGFDLFSEFVIPEFNNPFAFGNDEDKSVQDAQTKVTVPNLKRPVVPAPDAGILDTLPKLDSHRPSVPGLKLMRSKAPSHVPTVDPAKVDSEDENLEEEKLKEDRELGSGVTTAPQVDEAGKKLVNPDKILDEYKK
ncbi:MAG: hypothetical protein HOB20_04790 [Planctomycetaceae bacterium]|nr:hypothetical protein [Planctomycetaceae bacterium]